MTLQGACAGAGLGWASACDLRICDETAKFNVAFLDVGDHVLAGVELAEELGEGAGLGGEEGGAVVEAGAGDAALETAAAGVGYPLLVKASAGGGEVEVRVGLLG